MTVRTYKEYKYKDVNVDNASKCMRTAFPSLALYRENESEVILVSGQCPMLKGSFDEWSRKIQDYLGDLLIVRITRKFVYLMVADDACLTIHRASIMPNEKWKEGWFDIEEDGTSGMIEYIMEYGNYTQVYSKAYYDPEVLKVFKKMGVESDLVHDMNQGN